MVKIRKYKFSSEQRVGEVTIRREERTYKLQDKWIKARKRELLKAGFLESYITPDHTEWNEISRLDNDYEAGLLSLTLKDMRKLNILKGRENHIKVVMDVWDLGYEDAKRRVARDIWEKNSRLGSLDDYIEWYY